MKKKIRDLTLEEAFKFCRSKGDCHECPCRFVACFCMDDNLWVEYKELYSDKFLDQEVEI